MVSSMKRLLAPLLTGLLGTLTACNSTTVPVISEKTPSQLKAEALLGEWDMRYEGVQTYVTILKFTGTFQDKDDPSKSYAYGYDDANNGAVGYYDFTNQIFVLNAGSFDSPSLFQFVESSSNIVTGCSFYKLAGTNTTTPCLPISGTHLSLSAQQLGTHPVADQASLQQRYTNTLELLNR